MSGNHEGVQVSGLDVVLELPTTQQLTWRYFWGNPGNALFFPKLSNLATIYDRFRINSLELVYYPSCAMTTPGAIGLGISEDPSDDVPADFVALGNYRCSAMGNVAAPLSVVYQPKSAFNLPCFTSAAMPDPVAGGRDPLYTGMIRCFVMMKDGPASQVSSGYLAVKYNISLYAFRPTPQKALSSLVASPDRPVIAPNTYTWLQEKWEMVEGAFNTANGMVQLWDQWVAGGSGAPTTKPAIQDSFTVGRGSYSVNPKITGTVSALVGERNKVTSFDEESSYYINPAFDAYHQSDEKGLAGHFGDTAVAVNIYGYPLDGINPDGTPATQAVVLGGKTTFNPAVGAVGVGDKFLLNFDKAYRVAIGVLGSGLNLTIDFSAVDVARVSSYLES